MICPNCQQEATAVNHNNRGWRTTCCWSRVPEPEPEEIATPEAEPEEQPLALDLDVLEAQDLQEYLDQKTAEILGQPEEEQQPVVDPEPEAVTTGDAVEEQQPAIEPEPEGQELGDRVEGLSVPEPQTLNPVVINTGDGVDDQEASAAGQALAARRKQSKNKAK